MGRGRAKAKQTKVARELKYNTPQTDFEALRAELSGHNAGKSARPDGDDDDVFSRYVDDDDGDHAPDGGR